MAAFTGELTRLGYTDAPHKGRLEFSSLAGVTTQANLVADNVCNDVRLRFRCRRDLRQGLDRCRLCRPKPLRELLQRDKRLIIRRGGGLFDLLREAAQYRDHLILRARLRECPFRPRYHWRERRAKDQGGRRKQWQSFG